jgi:hypothetical protein
MTRIIATEKEFVNLTIVTFCLSMVAVIGAMAHYFH